MSKPPPLVLGAACTAFDLIPAQPDEITATSMSPRSVQPKLVQHLLGYASRIIALHRYSHRLPSMGHTPPIWVG
jgi:hypothetical protein